jgi:transcription elongation factor GreA
MVEHDGTAKVGSLVEISDNQGELSEVWRIALAYQADPSNGLLSEDSPLARALVGHRAGELVGVALPGARRRVVRIVRVGD